jgi:hypothetical protein
LLLDIFGEENCFVINNEEMVAMVPNIFSIDHDIVVTDGSFTRLNQHLREKWNFTVEEIPYREVSKMGGLLLLYNAFGKRKIKFYLQILIISTTFVEDLYTNPFTYPERQRELTR